MTKLCKNCNNPIVKQKPSEVKRSIFCSLSCSSSYNNRKNPKRVKKIKYCECGAEISGRGKRCSDCNAAKWEFLNVSKKQLFAKCKNWQTANSMIRHHARKVYQKNGGLKRCDVCGYDRHVQISHKQPVSDFSDESNVRDEINNFNNLVALCPNHHWELDNGLRHGQQAYSPVSVHKHPLK